MKKLQLASICILAVALVIMGIHFFIIPLSDWIVRIDGIIMLIGLFLSAFSTVKIHLQLHSGSSQ